MQESKILNYLAGTISKVEILRVLFENDDAMTGRRIALIGGLSPRSCQLSLDNLVKNKVLFRKAIGRAYAYTINREHMVASDLLLPIFEQEKQLHKEVNKLMQQVLRPYGKQIVATYWKLNCQRKNESVNIAVAVNAKKGFPTKELTEKFETEVSTKFGFETKCEVVQASEYAGKFLGSASVQDSFAKDWMKTKGLSITELLELSGKAPKAKAATK